MTPIDGLPLVSRDRLTLTIPPDGERGVSVERFVAALQAAEDLLTAMDPSAEPYLWLGGHVDWNGAVTIEVGPARQDADASAPREEVAP